MADALLPYRSPQPARPGGDPAPLAHLWDAAGQESGALDIDFTVTIQSEVMRAAGLAAHPVSRGNARMLYWTVAQMVADHTSNGCNLNPGDLFGSGTVSGTDRGTEGCLLEMTRGGREPITLPGGETRRYLEDGDEVALHARCRRDGLVGIGFGVCAGRVLPSR